MAIYPKCCSTQKLVYFNHFLYQFIIGDLAVVVYIVPEYIFDDVFYFRLAFHEDFCEGVGDFLFVESMIKIGIEFDQEI